MFNGTDIGYIARSSLRRADEIKAEKKRIKKMYDTLIAVGMAMVIAALVFAAFSIAKNGIENTAGEYEQFAHEIIFEFPEVPLSNMAEPDGN